MVELGKIIVLNGAPRSGKSSIVERIQATFTGVWMNLGADVFVQHVTPERYRPGIGLRPSDGERPDIEALLPALYAAFYDSVAAHARNGLHVVADVGHHDAYSRPLGLLPEAARRLDGLPVWLIGVRCPVEVIVERREATVAGYVAPRDPDGRIAAPVLRWQDEVHQPGIYDLEVDTSINSPTQSAQQIERHLEQGPPPSAMAKLRASI